MLHTWTNENASGEEIANLTFDVDRLSVKDYMSLKWSQHVVNQSNAGPEFSLEHFTTVCNIIAASSTASKNAQNDAIGDISGALQALNWTKWVQMNNFFTNALQAASSGDSS